MKNETVSLTGIVLDENTEISLRELCRACGVNAEFIMDMVQEGMVEPRGSSPKEWCFAGTAVKRVQVTVHLQRDLRVNLSGAALVLDLLEELEELRRLQWREMGS